MAVECQLVAPLARDATRFCLQSWIGSVAGLFRPKKRRKPGYEAVSYIRPQRDDDLMNMEGEAATISSEMSGLMLRELLNIVPEIIYFKDCDSRFMAVSQTKAARHGCSDPVELLGMSDADLFGPEHATKARSDEAAIMGTNTPIVGKIERLIWPDDRESWVMTSKYPLRAEDGTIVGIFGVSRDITVERDLEAKLDATRERLAVASEDSIRAELATGVLHDVNNAIMQADFGANFILSRLEKGNPDTPTLFSSEMLEAARSLRDCIRHMTAVIRAQQTHAHAAADCEILNPAALIQDALRITHASLQGSAIEATVEASVTEGVLASRHAVLQILANLVLNARDAITRNPEGARRLTLRASGHEGWIDISVTDTGQGISPENLPRLFSRGFTTRPDGHGFGLHSSRQTAVAMGGNLTAESPPGSGATFTLRLPAAKPA